MPASRNDRCNIRVAPQGVVGVGSTTSGAGSGSRAAALRRRCVQKNYTGGCLEARSATDLKGGWPVMIEALPSPLTSSGGVRISQHRPFRLRRCSVGLEVPPSANEKPMNRAGHLEFRRDSGHGKRKYRPPSGRHFRCQSSRDKIDARAYSWFSIFTAKSVPSHRSASLQKKVNRTTFASVRVAVGKSAM